MPRDYDSPPAPEYLGEFYQHLQKYWSKQFTEDEENDLFYWDEQKVDAKDTKSPDRLFVREPERMTSQEAPRIVDVIASLFPDPPQIGARWMGEKARRPSTVEDVVEKPMNQIVALLNRDGYGPWFEQRTHLVKYGRSARLIVHGGDDHAAGYWSNFPYKAEEEMEADWRKKHGSWWRKAPIPILWLALDPRRTFPATFGSMEDEVLTWWKVSMYELGEMFEEYGDVSHENWEKSAVLVCHANRRYLTYGVIESSEGMGVGSVRWGGGKLQPRIMGEPIEHKQSRCPIRILPGLVSGEREPGKYWMSALRHVRELIRHMDRRLSDRATAAHTTAEPMFKLGVSKNSPLFPGHPDHEKFRNSDALPVDPGDPSQGRPAESIDPLYIPPFGREDMELIQYIGGQVRAISATPAVLEGTLPVQDIAAWTINFISELTTGRHRPMALAIVQMTLDAAEGIQEAAIAFDDEFPVAGPADEDVLTLDPKALRDWRWMLKGDYRAKTPSNRRADLDMAVKMEMMIIQNNLPFPNIEKVGELIGEDQPWDSFKTNMTWKIATSDEMIQVLIDQIKKELELDDEEVSPEEAMQLAQSGQVSPAMAQVIMRRMGGQQPGGNGAQPSVTPQTQGALRAGAPLSTGPGGPQPSEEMM